MKVLCPACGERIEIDSEIYEEGDPVECPNCGKPSTIIRKGKKAMLVEGDNEEFYGEEEEEDEEGDYYS